MPTVGADPRVAGERDREGDQHGGHDQRRPEAIAVAEQQAGAARAGDEHQHARIGHVVRQRAVGAFAEIVVLKEAVLGDADQRDDRADADDDGAEAERHPASCETIDNGNDQKQHELFAVDQALVGFVEPSAEISVAAPYAASSQNIVGACTRS